VKDEGHVPEYPVARGKKEGRKDGYEQRRAKKRY
jgi:hypothetical protein